MKTLILMVIGNLILLILLIDFLIRTFKLIQAPQRNFPWICLNLALVLILAGVLFAVGISVSYNYYYERGLKLANQEDFRGAVECLRKTLLLRNQIGKLTNFLDKGVLGIPFLFSTELEIRCKLSNLYRSLGEYQNAINEYRNILSIDKNNFDATAGISETLFLTRSFDEAKRYYAKLVKIETKEKDFSYYLQTGRAFMVLGNYEKAVERFEKALEFNEKGEVIRRYLEICRKELTRGDR